MVPAHKWLGAGCGVAGVPRTGLWQLVEPGARTRKRKEHQGCEKCSELVKTAQVWENSRAAQVLCVACMAAPVSVLGIALSEYPGSAGRSGCT